LFKPFTPPGSILGKNVKSQRLLKYEPLALDFDETAQFISFLEKCVDANGAHQGNEENEEFCPAPKLAAFNFLCGSFRPLILILLLIVIRD
jgi:hypothetical protein